MSNGSYTTSFFSKLLGSRNLTSTEPPTIGSVAIFNAERLATRDKGANAAAQTMEARTTKTRNIWVETREKETTGEVMRRRNHRDDVKQPMPRRWVAKQISTSCTVVSPRVATGERGCSDLNTLVTKRLSINAISGTATSTSESGACSVDYIPLNAHIRTLRLLVCNDPGSFRQGKVMVNNGERNTERAISERKIYTRAHTYNTHTYAHKNTRIT